MMSSGVRPIIFFASMPIARIELPPRLPCALPTATTDGSLITTPFPGIKTRTFVVPRSMPSFGEKKDILWYMRSNHSRNGTLPVMQGEMNFVIEGGNKLTGTVETSRSKNGAVALLAASLLNRGTTTLEHVPRIEEVNRLIEVLRSLDVSVEWKGTDVIISPPEKISLETIDRAAAMRTRSILMFIGSLVHSFRDFELPQSGGCTLGLRSARPHLMALEKFGVNIVAHSDNYQIT